MRVRLFIKGGGGGPYLGGGGGGFTLIFLPIFGHTQQI